LRIAYLVNQYPMVSLTFIRREIRALEAQGFSVDRFSIRPWGDKVVDAADREELAKTRCILAQGPLRVLGAVLAALITRPGKFLSALGLALRVVRGSDRGVLMHLAYLAEACVLVRWLDAAGSEHLHAHFASNPAEVAMFCRVLGGPPYSFTVHGPEEFDRALGLGYAEKVRRAKFVAAISEFCRSQIFRWTDHRDWDKVQIVHCGLDGTMLGTQPVPPSANARLVCVGRLCEQKGHLALLQAAALLKAEGVRCDLVLVGDGEMRPQVEAAIAALGLRDRVQITGWVDNARVRAEIVASAALVLPSFAEGLPVVLMESFALGRPAISTYVAGIPELLREGVNGALVPPGNVPALADAMRALLKLDSRALTEMGERGRAMVEAEHDVSKEAAKLARFFRTA
jgi:colanic acid/amylovoran biosynthesis glycosyltransferase